MTKNLSFRSLSVLAALACLQCAAGPGGRYAAATDPGSRYGFKYVRDKTSGRWVNREFELRVDARRELPQVWSSAESGDRLSLQMFQPGTAKTGGLFSGVPVREGAVLVWRGADVLDEEDVAGKTAYGVSVSWPNEGKETKYDPLEVFGVPPLGETAPEQWSEWATAAMLRTGAMAWWDQTVGRPSELVPPPMYPFEFRWRVVFTEIPGRVP